MQIPSATERVVFKQIQGGKSRFGRRPQEIWHQRDGYENEGAHCRGKQVERRHAEYIHLTAAMLHTRLRPMPSALHRVHQSGAGRHSFRHPRSGAIQNLQLTATGLRSSPAVTTSPPSLLLRIPNSELDYADEGDPIEDARLGLFGHLQLYLPRGPSRGMLGYSHSNQVILPLCLLTELRP